MNTFKVCRKQKIQSYKNCSIKKGSKTPISAAVEQNDEEDVAEADGGSA